MVVKPKRGLLVGAFQRMVDDPGNVSRLCHRSSGVTHAGVCSPQQPLSEPLGSNGRSENVGLATWISRLHCKWLPVNVLYGRVCLMLTVISVNDSHYQGHQHPPESPL